MAMDEKIESADKLREAFLNYFMGLWAIIKSKEGLPKPKY